MIEMKDLLAAARSGAGIPSNYRLAKVLGVTDQTVSNWQNGRRFPDDALAVRLAEMGHLNPGEVLVSIYAQRAADGPMSGIWASIAQRVHDSAHGALAAVFGTAVIVSALFAASPDAAAATVLVRPVQDQSPALPVVKTPQTACILCQLSRAALDTLSRLIGRFRRGLTPQVHALQCAPA